MAPKFIIAWNAIMDDIPIAISDPKASGHFLAMNSPLSVIRITLQLKKSKPKIQVSSPLTKLLRPYFIPQKSLIFEYFVQVLLLLDHLLQSQGKTGSNGSLYHQDLKMGDKLR